MQQGFDEAVRYVRSSTAFRAAFDIAPEAGIEVEPLAQGEHNSNFWFAHPETGRKAVLRLNYASQLGLENQVSYEYAALKALEPSGRAPKPLFVDDSKTVIDRGVLAMEFCDGDLLDYECAGDVDEAARALADIHSVRPSIDCGLLQPADPLREQLEECVRLFGAYRSWAHAEERVIDAVDRLLRRGEEAVRTAPPARDRDHVLNTEAIAAHFLIPRGSHATGPGVAATPSAGPLDAATHGAGPLDAATRGASAASITRVVDWEKPILGEATQDVAYFLSPTTTIWDVDYIFSDDERASFVETYWRAVDGRFARDGFDERFAAYVMTNCLRGITWSAAASVEYCDPTRELKNEKTAARLGLYLSPAFLADVERRFFA